MAQASTTAATSNGKARSKATKAQDAISLLKADHEEVAAMFKKFENGRLTSDRRLKLAGEICRALSVHTQIEEEILYPAARDALKKADMNLIDEAEVEHRSIKDLVATIEAGRKSDLFEAQIHVMGEWVSHHVKEEETAFFPKLKKTRLDMAKLGARLAARKDELMAELADKD